MLRKSGRGATTVSILPVLAAQLLATFQSRGTVDHTHMAMAADLALGDDTEPTDLALRLDYQIQHILVDEFQDTSRTQFQLLEKLVAAGRSTTL